MLDITEPPIINSLLIAERVYCDKATNQWIIAGVFNQVTVNKLPAIRARIEVFLQLTNISQPVDFQFRIEHESSEVVLEFGGKLKAPNPLHVIEQCITLQNITFKNKGKYWVQLLHHEQILTQAPFYVILEQS